MRDGLLFLIALVMLCVHFFTFRWRISAFLKLHPEAAIFNYITRMNGVQIILKVILLLLCVITGFNLFLSEQMNQLLFLSPPIPTMLQFTGLFLVKAALVWIIVTSVQIRHTVDSQRGNFSFARMKKTEMLALAGPGLFTAGIFLYLPSFLTLLPMLLWWPALKRYSKAQ